MSKAKILLVGGLVALVTLGLSWPAAHANHVRIEVTPEPTQQGTTTIVVPPPPPTVTPGPPAVTSYTPAAVPQTLQADEIRAHQVRAHTIYANKIEADEIQGAIHQNKNVKIGRPSGDIKAPLVSASVIYADEIKANSVVADHVYVRDLKRR